MAGQPSKLADYFYNLDCLGDFGENPDPKVEKEIRKETNKLVRRGYWARSHFQPTQPSSHSHSFLPQSSSPSPSPPNYSLEQVINYINIALPVLPHTILRTDVTVRLSNLRKAGYSIKPYGRMSDKEVISYYFEVRREISGLGDSYCPDLVRDKNREVRFSLDTRRLAR